MNHQLSNKNQIVLYEYYAHAQITILFTINNIRYTIWNIYFFTIK